VEDMEMESVDRKDCWRCHTIFHWPHLKQRKTVSPLAKHGPVAKYRIDPISRRNRHG
jgi:hypothetical protein